MADMNITKFKAAIDGKMRPNRYLVSGECPGFGKVPSLLVKAASYPAASIGIIQLPYRGRIAKMPGDRAYPEWTFSVYDTSSDGTEGGDLRKAFEEWNRTFNDHTTNIAEVSNFGGAAETGPDSPFPDWTVTLLDTAGTQVRTIRLKSCWPVEVGAIDLTYDAADTLTEYTVTLAFDYLEVGADTGSSGSGNGS